MIRVENVTRRYGATVAVDDVSFAIGAGEIVGFLGENGAGKSTLLRMLSTYLEPDAGAIEVAGFDDPGAARDVVIREGPLIQHDGHLGLLARPQVDLGETLQFLVGPERRGPHVAHVDLDDFRTRSTAGVLQVD